MGPAPVKDSPFARLEQNRFNGPVVVRLALRLAHEKHRLPTRQKPRPAVASLAFAQLSELDGCPAGGGNTVESGRSRWRIDNRVIRSPSAAAAVRDPRNS